jgi:hypothetical protein
MWNLPPNLITKSLNIYPFIPRSINFQLAHEFTPEFTDLKNSVN